MKEFIGRRIKDERTRQNLTQDELISEADLGWERQTLGQVEKGERDLKAWELAKISKVLNLEMNSFFPADNQEEDEPYVLWRDKPQNSERLEADFIRLCKDYKLVEEYAKVDSSLFRKLPAKEIDLELFSFKDAYSLAENIRAELVLGDYPSQLLVKVLEEKYGIKFFFNQLDGNGSAASSVSKHGSCILISSSEPVWRQHFSIAHELFHIITWSKKLLDQVVSNEKLREYNEQLANAFAAGLLVPAEALRRETRLLAKENKLNDASIVALARQFDVSLESLIWRMVNIAILDRAVAIKALSDQELKNLDKETRLDRGQYLSSRFVRLAYVAYASGEISRGRLSKMLNQSMSALTGYLKQFGFAEVSSNEIALANT